ncbi:MAG TPA: M48 family metallopeptidase [Micromonosporaceae bacterium]|nr:M48 family metallopeptidase [Micromonosporaceae bacterium]
MAYRLTRRQFGELARRDLGRPGVTAARVTVFAMSVLLLVAVLGLAAAGVWLITYDFPAFTILPGAVLVLSAIVIRPRFGRLSPLLETVSRAEAPTLHALLDRVAFASGAPPPHVVAVDKGFNAYAWAVGLRRRRVLCIGLGLWATLPPQQRVALLGHELGHFANGDVRRGLLTQPAYTTLAAVAGLLSPTPQAPTAFDLGGLATTAAQLFQWVLSRVLLTAHVALLAVGLRDTQRAEYLADDMAATAAGSDAVAGLLDCLLMVEQIKVVVSTSARNGAVGPAWVGPAQRARDNLADRLPLLRQLSVRDDVSLFASHPPAGLRARMVEARGSRPPAVSLTEGESAAIDAEMTRQYERARRDLAWSG